MGNNVINLESYKNRNKVFRESYEVEQKQLIVPNIRKSEERFVQPKEKSDNMRKNSNKKFKKIRNRVLGIGLAGLVAFGGYTSYNAHKDNQNVLSIEQALENGESLETLGIDQSIKDKIVELQETMKRDLSNKELVDLNSQVLNLQFDTIKTKISKALDVDESQIKVYPRTSENEGARIDTNEKIYVEKDFLAFENTISSEIADYIGEIEKMQTVSNNIEKKDFNRNEILKKYNEALSQTSKLAASKIEIDDKGNMELEKIKVSSLENEEKGEER